MAATSIAQATKATNATAATSHAFPVTTAVRNTLYLFVSCVTRTVSVTGITDSASNANWGSLGGAGDATQGNIYLWWCPRAQAITTLTVAYSASTKTQLGFVEVGGGPFVGVGDTSGATPHFTAATTHDQIVASTVNPHNFLIAGYSGVPAVTSVSSPYTLLAGASGGGAGMQLGVAWDEEYALGNYTCTFTIASSAISTTMGASSRLNEIPSKRINVNQTLVRSYSY